MRFLKKNKKLLIPLIIMLFMTFFFLIYITFFINKGISNIIFLENPYLNDDKTHLNFILNKFSNNIYFNFIGVGANSKGLIKPFCNDTKCSIPLIIGGYVTLELILFKKSIFKTSLLLHDLSINCTNEPWTNRICTFKDICFKNNKFYITSPYSIKFDSKMLCLGSKTPPVDLEVNRLIDMFETQTKFPKELNFITQNANLVSIYYNIQMLWHHFFDYLLPLYQTLTLEGNLDYKRVIYLMGFVDKAPELTSLLTKNSIGYLRYPTCFKRITMGMVKITDLNQDKNDPPYNFCKNCSFGLRNAILKGLNIKDNYNPQIKKAILLLRNSNIRKLLNPEVASKAISELTPNLNVSVEYFENKPLKYQIELLSQTNIFISVHGSGLANLLWMYPGSIVIEIMPDQFTCRDWYKKAANAVGIHYFAYYADGINEKTKIQSEQLKKCLPLKDRCIIKDCIDALRDQNVIIDPIKFKNEITQFLNNLKM